MTLENMPDLNTGLQQTRNLGYARTRASIARQGFDVIRATLRSPREAYHARAAILTYVDCLAVYSDLVTSHSDAVLQQMRTNEDLEEERNAAYDAEDRARYAAQAAMSATHYGLVAIVCTALGWAVGLLCGVASLG